MNTTAATTASTDSTDGSSEQQLQSNSTDFVNRKRRLNKDSSRFNEIKITDFLVNMIVTELQTFSIVEDAGS